MDYENDEHDSVERMQFYDCDGCHFIVILTETLRSKKKNFDIMSLFQYCFPWFTSPSNNANNFYAITFIDVLVFPFTTNLFYILCFFIFFIFFKNLAKKSPYRCDIVCWFQDLFFTSPLYRIDT